jgi:hypothetical protein
MTIALRPKQLGKIEFQPVDTHGRAYSFIN